VPRVQYDLDSSKYIKYPINVDISTDLPGGSYSKYIVNTAEKDYWNQIRIMDISTNYMVLDSSHYDRGSDTVDAIV